MLSNLSETTAALVEDVLAQEHPYNVIKQLSYQHSAALSEIHTPIEIFKYVANHHTIEEKLLHALKFTFLLAIDSLQIQSKGEFEDQRHLMLTNALFKAINQLIEQPTEPSRNVLLLLLNLSAFNINLPPALLSVLHESCDNRTDDFSSVEPIRKDDLSFMFERIAKDPELYDAFAVYQNLVDALIFFPEDVVEVFVEHLFTHSNPKLHDSALYFLLNENFHIVMAAYSALTKESTLAHATIQDQAKLQVMRHWMKDSKRIHADQLIRDVQCLQPKGNVARGGYKLLEAKATLADYSESYLIKLSLQPINPAENQNTIHAYCHFALRSGIENIQLLHNHAELFSYEQLMQESELEFKPISEAQLQQLIQHTLSQQSLQNPPAELLYLWECYDSDCFYPQPFNTEQAFTQTNEAFNHFSRDELIEQWILLDMDYHSEFTPENTDLLQQHLIHALIIYQGQKEMMEELKEVAAVFGVHGDFYATSLGLSCHAHMMEAASELHSLPEDLAIFEQELNQVTESQQTYEHRSRPKNYWLRIEAGLSDAPIKMTLKINDAVNLSKFHAVLALLSDRSPDSYCTFESELMVFTNQPGRYSSPSQTIASTEDHLVRDLFAHETNACVYTNDLNSPQILRIFFNSSEPVQDLNLFPVLDSFLTPEGKEDEDKKWQFQQQLNALFRGQLH